MYVLDCRSLLKLSKNCRDGEEGVKQRTGARKGGGVAQDEGRGRGKRKGKGREEV